jgi:hypothetical protein
MQKELANILRDKVRTLPFADLAMGIGQTVEVKELDSNNEVPIRRRFPVGYDEAIKDEAGRVKEINLFPDQSRKSIIFFEDYGVTSIPGIRGAHGFSSSLRLLSWMNRAKLVASGYAEISARCQSAIVGLLCHQQPQNVSPFIRLKVELTRIPPQDAALFGRYTFDETVRQYLRPPFEFFGIDLTSTFYVSDRCLDEIPWTAGICH